MLNPRYFIGLSLPEEVKDRLYSLTLADGGAAHRDISGVRWVRKANYHVTLRYLGPEENINPQQVLDCMQRIDAAPLSLSLSGVGVFPNVALWVGAEKTAALQALKNKVDEAIKHLPHIREDFPEYNPHMTLARLKGHLDHAALEAFLSKHAAFTLPPLSVSRLTLFKNETYPDEGTITQEYAQVAL